MSRFNLTALGGNTWSMAGDLTLDTVPDAWKRLSALIAASGQLTISLSRVTDANSAVLVMLLEALDLAGAENCDLKFIDIPEPLVALAGLSNIDQILTAH
ncbi:MAG: STAS domain-containing protein [bacterium]